MERTGIDNLIAYWSTTLEGVTLPPSVFYEMLDEEILAREVRALQTTRVFWREGGWFSARREYIRVRWHDLVFDICGFPAGGTFIVSWWLGTFERSIRNLFFEIPVVGGVLEEKLSPVTYYEIDRGIAFQKAIQNSVLSIVDRLTDQGELPRLTGQEREPIMADFYR